MTTTVDRAPLYRTPVTLNGKRVRLEPLRAEHEKDLFEASRDEEIWRYIRTQIPQPASLEEFGATFMQPALDAEERGSEVPFAVIDVAAILHIVRHAIRDFDRWDILERAQIGLFSFTKFLMWRDLQERTDALMQNKVVAHLVHRSNEPFPR